MSANTDLHARVPEVADLNSRIDATDFPTPQECADARYFLTTGGRTFAPELFTTTKGKGMQVESGDNHVG